MKQCLSCKKEYSSDLAVCPEDGQSLMNAAGIGKTDPFVGKIIIEKYRIERLLGRGGMGSVYEGKHLILNRQVAIKVMHAQITADATACARFIREAKASAKIDHPNALIIHDFGVLEEGGAFIVMEFISGESLRETLANSGAIPLAQALEWFSTICAVVEVAHRNGIVHRDLKPENIMLKEVAEGRIVKVVDFGLAKSNSSENSDSVKLTKTGELMGTPHYMAPELYDGESADYRADIYALGIIFYEMIIGSVPFTGSMENIIACHLFKDPKPASTINPAINSGIDEVIKVALKKNREERFASAHEFAEALKKAAQLEQSEADINFDLLAGVVSAATKQSREATTLKDQCSQDSVIDLNDNEPGYAIPGPVNRVASSDSRPTSALNSGAQPTRTIGMVSPPPVEYPANKESLIEQATIEQATLPTAGIRLFRRTWVTVAVLVAIFVVATGSYFYYQQSNEARPASSSMPAPTVVQPTVEPPRPVTQPYTNIKDTKELDRFIRAQTEYYKKQRKGRKQ